MSIFTTNAVSRSRQNRPANIRVYNSSVAHKNDNIIPTNQKYEPTYGKASAPKEPKNTPTTTNGYAYSIANYNK